CRRSTWEFRSSWAAAESRRSSRSSSSRRKSRPSRGRPKRCASSSGSSRSESVGVTFEERHFWLRRLHSLSGIVPIGGYLAFHLYENYTATRGADAYNRVTRSLQEMPFSLALEILVILVPLFFHGIYGLIVTSTSRPNVISNPYARHGMYFIRSEERRVGKR